MPDDLEAAPEDVEEPVPTNVPIYPWNDPGNGTPLAMPEGEATPTGEEAIAALREQSEATSRGEIGPTVRKEQDAELETA